MDSRHQHVMIVTLWRPAAGLNWRHQGLEVDNVRRDPPLFDSKDSITTVRAIWWDIWNIFLACESCQHYIILITSYSSQNRFQIYFCAWCLFPPLPEQCLRGCLHRGSETRDPSPQATSATTSTHVHTICSDLSPEQHWPIRETTLRNIYQHMCLHFCMSMKQTGCPSLSPRVLTPVTFMTPSDTGIRIREGSLSSFRLMNPHRWRHKLSSYIFKQSHRFTSTRSSFWRYYR